MAKCAKALRCYAEHGPALLEPRAADAERGRRRPRPTSRYQPLGVVLAIMPWNFPLWQAMRFAAPALMAGNVGLLKHASNVPQTALYMEELFRKAGFPDRRLPDPADRLRRRRAGPARRPGGRGDADRQRARPASRSPRSPGDALKKTVLELGGSDPFIVMPSADLDKAAEVAVTARCQNNGQSCIAAKRFFVHADVAEEFTRLFAEKLAALTVGDPMDEDTQVGPLATESGPRGRREVRAGRRRQGRDRASSAGSGRTARAGSTRRPCSPGITPEMDLYAEEVFGPVAALFTVGRLDEAIEIANATPTGSGRNLWSEDDGRAGAVRPRHRRRAWPSSTAWSPATRSCRSAASSRAATAAS